MIISYDTNKHSGKILYSGTLIYWFQGAAYDDRNDGRSVISSVSDSDGGG
jgi:hypothetical protein